MAPHVRQVGGPKRIEPGRDKEPTLMLAHLALSSALSIGLLVICLLLVLAFEATNGFHDAANAVATVIYTNSLKSVPAVVWSGIMNFHRRDRRRHLRCLCSCRTAPTGRAVTARRLTGRADAGIAFYIGLFLEPCDLVFRHSEFELALHYRRAGRRCDWQCAAVGPRAR